MSEAQERPKKGIKLFIDLTVSFPRRWGGSPRHQVVEAGKEKEGDDGRWGCGPRPWDMKNNLHFREPGGEGHHVGDQPVQAREIKNVEKTHINLVGASE